MSVFLCDEHAMSNDQSNDDDVKQDGLAEEDKKKKQRRTILGDHIEYFAGWQFEVMRRTNAPQPSFEMFPPLGLYFCDVLDEEKTARERELAIAAGMKKAEASRSIKVKKRVMAAREPRIFAFHPGDIFFRDRFGGEDWVQVMGASPDGPDQMLEIHFPAGGERFGYYIPATSFLDCLRTGQWPNERFRVLTSERGCILLSTAARPVA